MSNAGDSGRSLALGIGLILLLVVVTAFLFRGSLQQGMQADEVNRVINIIPLLHPDAGPIRQSTFELNIFGTKIPLMYKEYISTAYILRFLPLALFDDYLFGLRTLYWIYLVSSATVLFLVLRSRVPYMAYFAPLMMVTTPLYYPEIRIGFADSINVLFLGLGCHLISRFLQHPTSRSRLFWGTFCLFFAANQMFYFSWVIAGITLATLILYPRHWRRFVSGIKNWIVFVAASSLGLANVVIYNLASGFPTIHIFVNRLFFPDEYNKQPLDYSKTLPLAEDLWVKLSQVPGFLGPHWKFFVTVGLASILITLAFSLKWAREGRLAQKRVYLLPFLVLFMTLMLILLSPKTTRAGHYVYIIPFLQLEILTSILLLGGLFKSQRFSRLFLVGLPVLLVSVNFLASNQIVARTNQTGGTGLYSPAVFEFNDYLNEQKIDSNNIIFLTWGLHSQPYFLNKGQFHINQLIFKLIDKSTREEMLPVLKHLFSSPMSRPKQGDSLYFPLYAQWRTDINKALIGLVETYDGRLILEKVFRERSGDDVILLYRLDNLSEFTASFQREIERAPISQELHITRYGPMRVTADRKNDLPMWFIAEGLTPQTKIAFGGELLESIYSTHHMTALIPGERIQEPNSYPLYLYDMESCNRSESVFLEVASGP